MAPKQESGWETAAGWEKEDGRDDFSFKIHFFNHNTAGKWEFAAGHRIVVRGKGMSPGHQTALCAQSRENCVGWGAGQKMPVSHFHAAQLQKGLFLCQSSEQEARL